jgi:hypothetical protein
MSDRDDERPELPPPFVKMLEGLKADRKTLLRDKAYSNPDQLRAFMGQYLFARLHDMVELMGMALYDTYGLTVSNANQLQRLRSVMTKELRKLGSEVSDDADLPGASTEVLDDLQQSFYALGTLLSKKLPDDAEVQDAYNRCAEVLGELTAELMGVGEGDEGDEGDDEDEDDEDKGEKSESKKRESKKDDAASETEEPV